MALVVEPIYHSEYSVTSLHLGYTSDKVYANVLPALLGYW